jgi:sigma-B regulation protein RsbU (phosphoserine phosphatase)
LDGLNQLLCEKSLPGQFVTLFLFRLGPDGKGEFISAGHNPTYVYRAATGRIEKLFSEHHFLGMFDLATYQSRPFELSTGDVLVVHSDGLTDAQNPAEQMFGEKRLLDLIRREAPAGSQAIKQAVVKSIQEFTEGMPQTDDITLVVVEKYQ